MQRWLHRLDDLFILGFLSLCVSTKCLDIKYCTNGGPCLLQISDVWMKSLFSQVTFILDAVYASSHIFLTSTPNVVQWPLLLWPTFQILSVSSSSPGAELPWCCHHNTYSSNTYSSSLAKGWLRQTHAGWGLPWRCPAWPSNVTQICGWMNVP